MDARDILEVTRRACHFNKAPRLVVPNGFASLVTYVLETKQTCVMNSAACFCCEVTEGREREREREGEREKELKQERNERDERERERERGQRGRERERTERRERE